MQKKKPITPEVKDCHVTSLLSPAALLSWWSVRLLKEVTITISRCKLLYIECINNKVLLYSTGNYIQYPVINHNGKEYEKVCIYIYIYIYVCVCVYGYIYIYI